jgi:hypothetical protein
MFDQQPHQMKPIELAANLVKAGKRDVPFLANAAAKTIRDLFDLAKAMDDLCVCYRIGRRPSGKLLDRISTLKRACYFHEEQSADGPC